MLGLVVVLSVVAVGSIGAALWLARALGVQRSAREAAARDCEVAQAAAARSEQELASARAVLEAAQAQVAGLRVSVAELAQQLGAAERAHEAELAGLRERFAGERRAAEELHAAKLAAVEQARRQIEVKLGEFDEKCRDVFGALAARALSQSGEQFLQLARQHFEAQARAAEAELEKRRVAVDDLVRPIAETLRRTDEKLAALERQRTSDSAGLAENLRAVAEAHKVLRDETGRLVKALSRPEVRGRYGEIQLRRVAELAGMKGYCDFAEQESQRDADGKLLRPDMLVKLPNDRVLAVDAKTNTYAYVEAVSAGTPAEQEEHLERFARHVFEQVGALSKKTYWAQFAHAPEFVVMFLPGDQFLDAALQRRPNLIERAAESNVILATPSTLIALLRAVAVGWCEKRFEEKARGLLEDGKRLHDQARVAFGHIVDLGAALGRTIRTYNELVGSVDARLMPTLRRFEEAGARSAAALPEVVTVEVAPRVLTSLVEAGAG